MKTLKLLSIFCLVTLLFSCSKDNDGDYIIDNKANFEITYKNLGRPLDGKYGVLKIETSTPIDFWENGSNSTQSQDVKNEDKRNYSYKFKENQEFSFQRTNFNKRNIYDTFYEVEIGRGTYEIKGKNTIIAKYVMEDDDRKKEYIKVFENVKLDIRRNKNDTGREYFLSFTTTDPRFSTIINYELQDYSSVQSTAWVD